MIHKNFLHILAKSPYKIISRVLREIIIMRKISINFILNNFKLKIFQTQRHWSFFRTTSGVQTIFFSNHNISLKYNQTYSVTNDNNGSS